MPNLETYVTTLLNLRGATVPETSYYATLQSLLNEVGTGLRPHVQAVIHPKDTGAGIPDLGLYDDNQPTDQKPARGIVEAKPVSDDLLKIAGSEQVTRYVTHYGQALVTNYYQFVLVTRDPQTGLPVIEERYDLADNAAAFWEAAKHPRTFADKHATALREYLMRVMRRNAPLSSPQDVAWMLASYAREARARIETGGSDLAALTTIRGQLEASLGVRFEDETAEDFFRSTLVQTLFYGLFSAWVLWHEKHPGAGKFDLWRDTRRMNIPVISELFEQFSSGTVLPLSVEQILEWTADALNRVDRAAFFATFNRGAAVQYFYEPFLEAFDPELRRQLGVWYTPPEVVDYMVARVDVALKYDLGIPDGLADPNVYVLDPCCGTGAYLIAVLKHIYAALQARDGDALAGQAVQHAIRERIFGFEILPAPFVVAHLQIGILLNRLHAPLAQGQRAGIYLTNALTGWEPPKDPKTMLLFPELQKERDAADAVKRGRPILVILGNPPYSGFAHVAIEEERTLTEAYRTTQNPNLPRPQGQGLNDLYVRFYRMAERQIAETTQRGVVCFISNYSWLESLSHPGMRERFLNEFDKIYIDNLHGDRVISEYAPDGKVSETVFSIRGSSPGIKVGTAISTLIRIANPSTAEPRGTVYYKDWHHAQAEERRNALIASVKNHFDPIDYSVLDPIAAIGLPFKPRELSKDYLNWRLLVELFPKYFPGVQTKRDELLVDIDQDRLITRMQSYFDPRVSHEEIKRISPRSIDATNRDFDPILTRETLQKRGFLAKNVVRHHYRAFDLRWLYYEHETNLLQRRSPDYFPHVQKGNLWLASQQKPVREWTVPYCLQSIGCLDVLFPSASFFPLYLYDTARQGQLGMFETEPHPVNGRRPNLSDQAQAYLAGFELTPEDGAEPLFYHTMAILHSPAYRVENAGALRQDWPRVPLPKTRDALETSAALGRQVAALLDVETPVPGVTQGDPRTDLRSIGVLTTTNGGTPDFTVNVNWGYFGSGSAVMPGRGRSVEHEGLIDVYLNSSTYWKDLPLAVWEYTLGGYQVLKKWLSYRETAVLGRPLKAEEAREFMHIARRIAALLGLNAALDENYRAVTAG